MISLSEGVRIHQPMAKWAFVWVLLILSGVITSGVVILVGSVAIVGLDVILPWKVEQVEPR